MVGSLWKGADVNVIETHGLTKRYRRKLAVDNLDMTVAAGDIYGFVGKNGSGKSTTMKMVCGLARPTAGEVVLFGDSENGGATPQGFSRIGALIESPGVLASLTARDNLVAKALALGMTHAGAVADDLLALVRGKDHFVLTTNVDHQFQLAGFDRRRLFYTQGDYGLLQCGVPCHRRTYDNERLVRAMVEAQGLVIGERGELVPPPGARPP